MADKPTASTGATSGNRCVLMAPGIAESGQTDKYKKIGDGTLTNTMPIGGKDASISHGPQQVAAQDINRSWQHPWPDSAGIH